MRFCLTIEYPLFHQILRQLALSSSGLMSLGKLGLSVDLLAHHFSAPSHLARDESRMLEPLESIKDSPSGLEPPNYQ